MSIHDSIETAREAAKNRTKEERANLLRKANILDNDGYYLKKYFSSETVKIDKNKSKPNIR